MTVVRTLKRAIRKPPRVIAYRLAQEIRLEAMYRLRIWPRLEEFHNKHWSGRYADVTGKNHHLTKTIVADDAVLILQEKIKNRCVDKTQLLNYGQDILSRKFKLLGTMVPEDQEFNWHHDWRYNHEWRPTYFKSYRFNEIHKQDPYDVKMPWELSRLGFLLPMLQCAAFDNSVEWIRECFKILEDWEKNNPLAYTVNWYPMEASIRSINMVMMLDMLLCYEKVPAEFVDLLHRQLAKHGEFIWRTIEYTDVRGNHYAANIVALLLIGMALQDQYDRAIKWRKFAQLAIIEEIELQFLPDGVNFEKSVPYHRLVTELFLLALIVFNKHEIPVPGPIKHRLHLACQYAAACVKPDGLTPNVGDNDDARLFQFDAVPLRDFRPLIGVGAALFGDLEMKAIAQKMPAAVIWLLGSEGADIWKRIPADAPRKSMYFDKGGIIVSRSAENFFWMDVGEVGLKGRGGHGHNDLFSFELMLRQKEIIVDPGSYVYTASAQDRNMFRSTKYHNVVRIDKEELASMPDLWSIGNDAQPYDISVIFDEVLRVGGTHAAYQRLKSPATHRREVSLNEQEETFQCRDMIQTKGQHLIERFLHFSQAVELRLNIDHPDQVEIDHGGDRWMLEWDAYSNATIEQGWQSSGYNLKAPAPILVLTSHINQDTTLDFEIRPI